MHRDKDSTHHEVRFDATSCARREEGLREEKEREREKREKERRSERAKTGGSSMH
jgi:hypothetical protein